MDNIMLTVIIPARNEEWLNRTIEECLRSIEGNTEIIAILDGYLPDPPLTSTDPRVTIIYNPQSKGQRAGARQAVKLAKSKYIMKIDAHVALDKGFDVKMLEAFKKLDDNVTMVPLMRNLHVFDWICEEGHRRYQGNSGPCETCGKTTIKDVVWIPKKSPATFTFRFDKTMHFQYDGNQAKKPESILGALCNDGTYDTNLRETMSIQGSGFMMTKERYLALDIDSDSFNSWGQQGVEIACKTWLGPGEGRVISNLNTWYAHMFRTKGGDFGFPYPNPQSKVNENRELSRQLFKNNNWPLATRKFQWLLDKFNPPDWTETRGLVFCTDNTADKSIAIPVIEQLKKIAKEKNLSIVTAAQHHKLDFGVKNIYFPSLRRAPASLFKQMLGAVENSSADIIFFCEADVLYHPSHFDFVPTDKNVFYFNNNLWKIDWTSGKAIKTDKCEQISGMCVYRDTALNWLKEKNKQIEEKGFDGHYEPQGVNRGEWISREPNVDIRHTTNITKTHWSKEEFRNPDNAKGWQEGTIDQLWAKDIFHAPR